MDNSRVMKFVSDLGCTITVAKAEEHLGDGVILELRMEQEGDGRRAEVYLSEFDIPMLQYMLSKVVAG